MTSPMRRPTFKDVVGANGVGVGVTVGMGGGVGVGVSVGVGVKVGVGRGVGVGVNAVRFSTLLTPITQVAVCTAS